MGCCVSSSVAGEEYREAEVQQDEQLSKRDIRRAESLTAEGKADALLALIPSRMFTNGASDGACLFTQQGRKGTNQDAMVVWEVNIHLPHPNLNIYREQCFHSAS